MTNSTFSQSPKYLRLADELRARIQGGVLAPGDRLPSFSEMYAAHGVTSTTVNRVHGVLEQEGLIERIHGKGTFVASRARLTYYIGFLSEQYSNGTHSPYWVHLMEGIQSAAHEAGYEVLLLNPKTHAIRWERVDGLLTFEHDLLDAAAIPASLPHISLLNPARRGTAVLADDLGGTRQLVEHLLELGHTRIGRLAATIGIQNPLRDAGYFQAMALAKITPEPEWQHALPHPLPDGSFRVAGYDAMTAWLQNGWHATGCTALLCQNDETALGAMAALHKVGIDIPGEVSVAGFDGTELCEFAHPTLTSVTVPLRKIGARGVQRVLAQIQSGQPCGESVVLPTTLKIGASTAPPRC